jgi:hypothetical protein
MDLETLVSSCFNHLMRLVAREDFIILLDKCDLTKITAVSHTTNERMFFFVDNP